MTPETKEACIEAMAQLLWECFSPGHEIEWPSYNAVEFRMAASYALNAILPIIEPPGTVRVPIVPTPAMIEAGCEEMVFGDNAGTMAEVAYRAMISAAQEPAPAPAQESER